MIAKVPTESQDHPDVDELFQRASALDPNISVAKVYRTVPLFQDAGVLERLHFMDGRARYETSPEDHHDHLIDIKTGKVIKFRNEELGKFQRFIAEELGYKLAGHRLELYGEPLGKDKK